MREINQTEQSKIFKKLTSFIGTSNINTLFTENKDTKLMLHNKNIYLLKTAMLKHLSCVPNESLHHAGLLIGKLTKTNNFFLHVSSLSYLSKYCLNKVWIKKSAEMNVLYGNNIIKSHIFKISDQLEVNAFVVIFNSEDVILGFGVTTRDSKGIDGMEGGSVAIINQSDNGVYLRDE
ncbi:60S ribosome subunit biogenesis protein nip7 [Cucumispora dikerogammari]|nr:60S ribosome subunit biogenesis protein nip7 [Cucumispora dikerogammari]